MTLINDDCIKVLKEMKDESVDLIVTDPPYMIQKYGKCIHGGFISGTEVGKTGRCFDNIPDISLWGGGVLQSVKTGLSLLCYEQCLQLAPFS